MARTSVLFFFIGAAVLWGGFGISLRILLKNESEEVKMNKKI